MANNKKISREIIAFHGRTAPEQGKLVGYGAIIDALNLPVPIPLRLVLISKKRRQYMTDAWLVLTPRHQPDENLYAHLVFALKYEGVNLLFFKKLFEKLQSTDIEEWIVMEPQSQYGRRIWFLYEWLMQKSLQIPDLRKGNYIPLIDEKHQYAIPKSINSSRQRIKNNLTGNINFCPLITKTAKLERYIAEILPIKQVWQSVACIKIFCYVHRHSCY